jgi:hypothetical protein
LETRRVPQVSLLRPGILLVKAGVGPECNHRSTAIILHGYNQNMTCP